jgi:hypothetical protein
MDASTGSTTGRQAGSPRRSSPSSSPRTCSSSPSRRGSRPSSTEPVRRRSMARTGPERRERRSFIARHERIRPAAAAIVPAAGALSLSGAHRSVRQYVHPPTTVKLTGPPRASSSQSAVSVTPRHDRAAVVLGAERGMHPTGLVDREAGPDLEHRVRIGHRASGVDPTRTQPITVAATSASSPAIPPRTRPVCTTTSAPSLSPPRHGDVPDRRAPLGKDLPGATGVRARGAAAAGPGRRASSERGPRGSRPAAPVRSRSRIALDGRRSEDVSAGRNASR